MTEQGSIHLADLNEERRRRVLVVSSTRFHRAARRAVVIPEVIGRPDAVPFPWRIACDNGVFAVDFMKTLPLDRLLDRTGQANPQALSQIQRALRQMT